MYEAGIKEYYKIKNANDRPQLPTATEWDDQNLEPRGQVLFYCFREYHPRRVVLARVTGSFPLWVNNDVLSRQNVAAPQLEPISLR